MAGRAHGRALPRGAVRRQHEAGPAGRAVYSGWDGVGRRGSGRSPWLCVEACGGRSWPPRVSGVQHCARTLQGIRALSVFA